MNRCQAVPGLYKHSILHFEVFSRTNSPYYRRLRHFTSQATNRVPSTRPTLLFGTYKHSSSVPNSHFTQLNTYKRRAQASPLFAGEAAMITSTEADSMPGAPLSEVASMPWEEGPFEDVPTNGLRYLGPPFELEKVYNYEPGGLHPVNLGDTLGSGRYRVIHKLGSGGSGIVWLARDLHAGTPTYVALKILMAGASKVDCPELIQGKLLKDHQIEEGAGAICLFLDHFKLEGPNGTHFCFIYPVLGPKVSQGQLRSSGDPDKTLRQICRVTVQAMAFIHSKGICHGDFTANNVLQRICDLDGHSEHEVLETLGHPRTTDLVTDSGEPHTLSTAPKHAVYPVDWATVDTTYFTNEPQVNDLGEAFQANKPPKYLGIPSIYRSPELFLEQDYSSSIGFGSDLWALGCTLFEIRTGRKLFESFDDQDDEYLMGMVDILGPMPEPWWSTTWTARKRFYKDEADSLGHAIDVNPPPPPQEIQDPDLDYQVTVHPSVVEGARSLMEKLAPGVWYIDMDEKDPKAHRDISDKEKELFADLIGRFLKWKPDERISAEEALKHEWFNM